MSENTVTMHIRKQRHTGDLSMNLSMAGNLHVSIAMSENTVTVHIKWQRHTGDLSMCQQLHLQVSVDIHLGAVCHKLL